MILSLVKIKLVIENRNFSILFSRWLVCSSDKSEWKSFHKISGIIIEKFYNVVFWSYKSLNYFVWNQLKHKHYHLLFDFKCFFWSQKKCIHSSPKLYLNYSKALWRRIAIIIPTFQRVVYLIFIYVFLQKKLFSENTPFKIKKNTAPCVNAINGFFSLYHIDQFVCVNIQICFINRNCVIGFWLSFCCLFLH